MNDSVLDKDKNVLIGRVKLFNIFSLIGCSVLLIFGTTHLLNQNTVPGYIEIILGFAGLHNIFYLYVSKNIHYASSILLILMFTVLCVLLTTGGVEGTGLLWFFTFPLLAFFLKGRREGLIWIIFIIVLLCAVWYFQSVFLIVTPFSSIVLRQLIISFIVVSIFVYVYESINEQGLHTVQQEKTKLAELDNIKTEFITLASHQLRTPLTAIRWFVELLSNGDVGQLTMKQKKVVGNIDEATERMVELLSILLNVSRLESGKIILDQRPTDIVKLAKEVIKELQPRFKAKLLEVSFETKDVVEPVILDPKLIGDVYRNLLTNAIKYTPDKGHINVKIWKNNAEIFSVVQDTGYGIPKSQLHRVFTRFFRASNIMPLETEGSGLGLYLCHAIINSSGGRIKVDSEEGKGSTFFFSLPYVNQQKSARKSG